jgi:hypothetical protein
MKTEIRMMVSPDGAEFMESTWEEDPDGCDSKYRIPWSEDNKGQFFTLEGHRSSEFMSHILSLKLMAPVILLRKIETKQKGAKMCLLHDFMLLFIT